MEDRIEKLEECNAKIEARMKSHWALQTDDEFAETYLRKIKNDINSSIIKMAIGAVLLLAGSGFIFIKYAVIEQFNTENDYLITQLKNSYNLRIHKTDNNYEWRRFHDYGKDYVNLAKLYSKSPIEVDVKKQEIHELLDQAEKYFKDALSHGDMHASTYWELGELYYTYRIEMGFVEEVDKLTAVQKYKDSALRYTEVEINKGWRSEVYYRIGSVYWDLFDDPAMAEKLRSTYYTNAKDYLLLAKNEYSKLTHLVDKRSKKNIEGISGLLAKLEGVQP